MGELTRRDALRAMGFSVGALVAGAAVGSGLLGDMAHAATPPPAPKLTPEQARAHFAEVGAAGAASHSGSGSKHAFMHRTETIDYGIVLEGEITLIMDEGETVVRAGDIVIQRGTNHGWANRGNVPCRIAFILIDGRFDAELAP